MEAHAGSYYGAPYKINYFGDLETFESEGEAAAYLQGRMLAACSPTSTNCNVTINYRSANSGTLEGIGAVVSYTDGSNSFYVEATAHMYDDFKNLGGAGCWGSNGSPKHESKTHIVNTCPSAEQLDPINTSTGNKFQQDTDYSGSAWLTFRRFYNSHIAIKQTNVGVQWRHSFDRSLEPLQSTASGGGNWLVLYRPDGTREQFQKVSGAWTADTGVIDTIVEQDDAGGHPTGYTVFMAYGHEFEQYSPSGQLLSITDRDGQTTTLTYSTVSTPASTAPKPGLLLTVTDPHGRSLNFVYDSSARINTVNLPEGGSLGYTYDAIGNLSTATFPDNSVRQFVYNEANLTSNTNFPNALTGVIDEKNVRYENTGYDTSGRAISSSFAGGAAASTITYGGSTINGAIPATIKTPLGTSSTLTFQNYLGENKIAGISTSCGTGCTMPWKSISYDTNGWPATLTDLNSNVTSTNYSVSGLELQRIDAKGTASQRTTNTTWDAVLRNPLTRSTLDSTGALVAYQSFAYNNRGQVTASCEADPAVSGSTGYVCGSAASAPVGVRQQTYRYCDTTGSNGCTSVGLLLSETDPRGNITNYTYYQSSSAQNCGTPGAACYQTGDIHQIIDALGHALTIASYDGAGRPTRIIDANGNANDLTYTSRGWIDTQTVGGAKTSYGYDKVGSVTSVTDPDGVVTSYGYDDAHRLVKITDALGNYIQYTLDAADNRTAENIYANGSSTPIRTLTRKFNALGQLAQELDAQSRAIIFTYDLNGNLTDAKDRLSIITHTTYDALNRIASVTRNYNGTDTATKNSATSFSYDSLDRILKVTDPNSLVTSYAYDGLGVLKGLTSPDSGASSYVYDAAGNRIQDTDAKAVASQRTYDALNRITATTYPDSASNISYRYDESDSVTGCVGSNPIGRLTSIVETAVSTVYCYDARGNVVQKRQTQGTTVDTVNYTYTPGGRLASINTPDGAMIQYGRDIAGRINAVSARPPGASGTVNLVTSVVYLPFGPIASYTLGNGQTVIRSYDSDYRLSDVTSSAMNLHFARDAMGNITALGNAPGANPATETYHYDPLYRLGSINDATGTVIEAYTYNKTGDRLSKSGNGLATGTYGYQTGTHWLTTIGNSARSFDANGNTTGNSASGDTFGYGYNSRNRLTVVQEANQTVASYTYNALGERVAKAATAPQTVNLRFAYDEGSQLLSEYGTTNRDYVWMGDVPIAAIDALGTTAKVSYVYADGLGTPRVITDDAGSVQWQWPYQGNAFGEKQPTSASGYVFNLRLPGQYYDAESKLAYNINRYYEPSTSRYSQTDPIGLQGGVASYAYVSSQPLGATDTLGLQQAEELDLVDPLERERLIEAFGLRLGPNQANQIPRSEADIRVQEELAGKPCVNPANQNRGGVYRLIDPATGETVRTGRTNDLARRQAEHARDPVLGKYTFDVLARTDVYNEQRGLEQSAYEAYDAPLNYVRPIGLRNPNRSSYLQAADDYLIRAASGQK